MSEAEAETVVAEFDATPDEELVVADRGVLDELRAAAAARRDAESRVESAVIAAHRSGLSWGVIGAQLGITRQGARQRYEPIAGRD